MRSLVRIFFCLAAWLMLSPLAMATPPCVVVDTAKVLPCCEGDEPCEMPDMGTTLPCVKCPPTTPPMSLPAATVDFAPPLLVAFERTIVIWFEACEASEPLVAVAFHPPPPTLLALGTQLTC